MKNFHSRLVTSDFFHSRSKTIVVKRAALTRNTAAWNAVSHVCMEEKLFRKKIEVYSFLLFVFLQELKKSYQWYSTLMTAGHIFSGVLLSIFGYFLNAYWDQFIDGLRGMKKNWRSTSTLISKFRNVIRNSAFWIRVFSKTPCNVMISYSHLSLWLFRITCFKLIMFIFVQFLFLMLLWADTRVSLFSYTVKLII